MGSDQEAPNQFVDGGWNSSKSMVFENCSVDLSVGNGNKTWSHSLMMIVISARETCVEHFMGTYIF